MRVGVGQGLASRRRRLGEAGGLVLAFLLLALGMTYPLVLHLGDAIPGPPWDNLVWLYDLWWAKRTLLMGQGSPFFNPGLFAPFGYDLALSETMLANKLLVAPVLALGSPVLAYNGLVLLSFVLSGLGACLLGQELTGDRIAGFISGIIFAFAPYRMHVLAAGWLPLISTQWLPFLFWSLERGIRRNRWPWFALGGVFLGASVLSSWYYAYVVAPFALLYGLLRLRSWRGRLQVGLTLAVAGALVVPAAFPILRGAGQEMAWPLRDVEKWAASVDDFVLPQIYHPLWGRAVLSARAWVPGYPWYAPGVVGLGFVPLALVALAGWRRHREGAVKAWLVCAVLSLILALGTTLHWGGERVYIAVPAAVERAFARGMGFLMGRLALHPAPYALLRRAGAVPVPLPGLLLYLFLPFGAALRTMYRFGLVTIFSVAVLAGYGVAALLDGGIGAGRKGSALLAPTRRTGLGGLLAALVCLEFAVWPLGCGYTEIVEQPLDRWLAQLPAGTVIAQFPLVRALNGSALYRSVTHRLPMAYGHGTFYPPAYMAAKPVLDRFPSAETLDLLWAWGVRYVVVGVGAYREGWGDQPGQTWEEVEAAITDSGRLRRVYATQELPVWRGERVSDLIRGNLPVQPIVADQVEVFELLR